MKNIIMRGMLLGLILGIAPVTMTSADEERESQEFLFFLEEAYVQEKGEWQIGITTEFLDGAKSREIEYEDAKKKKRLPSKTKHNGS